MVMNNDPASRSDTPHPSFIIWCSLLPVYFTIHTSSNVLFNGAFSYQLQDSGVFCELVRVKPFCAQRIQSNLWLQGHLCKKPPTARFTSSSAYAYSLCLRQCQTRKWGGVSWSLKRWLGLTRTETYWNGVHNSYLTDPWSDTVYFYSLQDTFLLYLIWLKKICQDKHYPTDSWNDAGISWELLFKFLKI